MNGISAAFPAHHQAVRFGVRSRANSSASVSTVASQSSVISNSSVTEADRQAIIDPMAAFLPPNMLEELNRQKQKQKENLFTPQLQQNINNKISVLDANELYAAQKSEYEKNPDLYDITTTRGPSVEAENFVKTSLRIIKQLNARLVKGLDGITRLFTKEEIKTKKREGAKFEDNNGKLLTQTA